jgi:hypothetical protein
VSRKVRLLVFAAVPRSSCCGLFPLFPSPD